MSLSEYTGAVLNAREGQNSLKIAVMLVLCVDGGCLGPAEISRRAEIWRSTGSLHDAITYGVLTSLEADGLVERGVQLNGRPGWRAAPTAEPGSVPSRG